MLYNNETIEMKIDVAEKYSDVALPMSEFFDLALLGST